MQISSFRLHPLTLALHLTLVAIPALANAQSLYAGPGTNTSTTGEDFSSAEVDGATFLDGGRITGGATVKSTGDNGASLLAIGKHATSGAPSTIALTDSTITSTGIAGAGAWAEDDGLVKLTNSTIASSGARADGAVALGGTIEMEGGSVSVTDANSGNALLASGATGKVVSTNQTLSAAGAGTEVVRAERGAQVALTGSNALATGTGSRGVIATGAGSKVEGTGTRITVETAAGHGVVAANGGSVALTDSKVISNSSTDNNFALLSTGTASSIAVSSTKITSSGATSGGASAESGAKLRIEQGSSVDAAGAKSFGVRALGVGSEVLVDASTVATSGVSAVGAAAGAGGKVNLVNGADVSTENNAAYGVVATGRNAAVKVSESTVSTTGDNAPAAVAMDGGLITLDSDATVQASGANANALEVTGGGSRATANGSTLTSAKAAGIAMAQATSVELVGTNVGGAAHAAGFVANGSDPVTAPAVLNVSGGSLKSSGAAIQSQDIHAQVTLADGVVVTSESGRVAYAKDKSTLALTVRGTSLQGDLFAETGSALDLAIESGSSLEGAVLNGRTMSMVDGTSWTLTRSSDVASLANAGRISVAAPASGDHKTLTVHGDYVGNDGMIAINTALGDDTSPTDQLVVEGATAGNTSLHVNNVGGAGAYTTADGIQVVQVNGASNGVFALDGRVVAGANEYLLAQGGNADPADGDWYLRSEAPVVPDPVLPDPVTPDPASPDPTPLTPVPVKPVAPQPTAPLYRPEPAAYLGNQSASVRMFEHSMHDRMGEPNLGKQGDDGRTSAAWVRVVRNQMDGTTGEGQLDAGTDTSVLQIGGEIARANDSRFHIGLMGGTGRANTEVTSTLLDWRARGKVTGYNLGVYGSWFADAKAATGLYLDGWLQYGSYDNKVQGDLLATERYDSKTWAASIEAGYAIALNDGGNTRFFVEPQAQAIFTDYSASQHRENNGTLVDDVDAGGLTTRLGVRFFGHASNTQQSIVQPFVTLNWWHDDDRNRMSFNDTTLALETPRDRYEAKLGLQSQLGGGWTGWGNLGLTYGARDYRDVTGQLGLNYRW